MRLKAVPQECDQCPLNIYFIWNPLFVFLCVEMPQINFWGKILKILHLIGCLIWFNQSYDTRLAAVCCQLELAVAKHYKRWLLSLHWNHCQILPDFLRNPGIVTFDDTQFGFIKREKVGAWSHEMLGRAGEAWNIPNRWAGLGWRKLILGEILDKKHNKLRSSAADDPSVSHSVFTITEKAPTTTMLTNSPVPCAIVAISCLLTMG